MSTAFWVWVVGYPLAAIAFTVGGERERRASNDPFVQEATLRPALDGVIAGLVWPLIVVLCLLYLLWRVGRVLADAALNGGER